MFARITTFQGDAGRLGDMEARLDGMKAKIKGIPGIVDVYSVWRADGQGIVTAIYENQAAAEAASASIQGVWGDVMDLLQGPPTVEAYENVAHMTG